MKTKILVVEHPSEKPGEEGATLQQLINRDILLLEDEHWLVRSAQTVLIGEGVRSRFSITTIVLENHR